MAFVIKPLQSFTAEAQAQDKKLYLYQIDPLKIEEEDGFNLRYYDDPKVVAHIESFCASFLQERYVPPMVVCALSDGRIMVIEGHCRRRGLRMAIAKGAHIPLVSVIPFRGNDIERVELMLRSAQGLKLEALDIARGYLRLQDMGISAAEIAVSQGKTAARVRQFLMLAQSDPQVQALVRSQQVSPDAAIEAVQEHGAHAVEILQRRLEEVKLSGRLRLTKSRGPKKPKPTRKMVESVFTSVEAALVGLPEPLRRRAKSLQKRPQTEQAQSQFEVSGQVLVGLLEAGREVEKLQRRTARWQAKLEVETPPQAADFASGSDCSVQTSSISNTKMVDTTTAPAPNHSAPESVNQLASGAASA